MSLRDKTSKRVKVISKSLSKETSIISARVYGSSLYANDYEDLDVAVMVPSKHWVVQKETYQNLLQLRKELNNKVGIDIDLIPHTMDEIKINSSPLWNPRYHPSLKFGIDVKAHFPVPKKVNPKQDASIYVLLDNRTITRRQVLMESGPENWRIFIAKLIHGPGNVLTYFALQNNTEYKASPSDIETTFSVFDSLYATNSQKILRSFSRAKELIKRGSFSFKHAVELLQWYERLVSRALVHKYDLG